MPMEIRQVEERTHPVSNNDHPRGRYDLRSLAMSGRNSKKFVVPVDHFFGMLIEHPYIRFAGLAVELR